MKKKACYCRNITRKDGSKILCMNCEHTRITEILKSKNTLLTNADIRKSFIEKECLDDIHGEINGVACKLCYILFDYENQAIRHFKREHMNL